MESRIEHIERETHMDINELCTPCHKCIMQGAPKLLELTNNELYLMRLLNHRAIVNHLVVMIMLNDIRLIPNIKGIILTFDGLHELSCTIYIYVHITEHVRQND
jgi:hypothetical protein